MLSVSMRVSGLGVLSESTREVKVKPGCGLCDPNCKPDPRPQDETDALFKPDSRSTGRDLVCQCQKHGTQTRMPFGNISTKYHPQDF